jgi:hypothetical protein
MSKELTLGKKAKSRTTTDKIIRISLENYNRLKLVKKLSSKEYSYNDVIESMLRVAEIAADHGTMYLVGGKVLKELEDARGEAVMLAAKQGLELYEIPIKLVVIVGESDANSL